LDTQKSFQLKLSLGMGAPLGCGPSSHNTPHTNTTKTGTSTGKTEHHIQAQMFREDKELMIYLVLTWIPDQNTSNNITSNNN
jgi:hypothetical protein